MAPLKVMIIRHAEKPIGEEHGVDVAGAQDDQQLSVRGWQRAGALVRFFAPKDGRLSHPQLACPDVIFAAGVGPESESKRHIHTVGPLAALLGAEVGDSHLKHQSQQLADAIKTTAGVVLVAWEHKEISRLADYITDHSVKAPAWPQDRFDMVFILDRREGRWTLTQAPQLLLAGDRGDPLQ
jgi:hypothetical protein